MNDKILSLSGQENIFGREFDIAKPVLKDKEAVVLDPDQIVSPSPAAGVVAAGNASFTQVI